jgi:GST-like protein
MIDFYGLTSPNVQKIFIMLEECGLPYNFKPVDVWASAQHAPDFVKLNPNRKIPVIVDQDGPGGKPYTVFESGAILMYLADNEYLAGSDYTIADMATFPWTRQHAAHGVKIDDRPHFKRWFEELSQRPAIKAMIAKQADIKSSRETATDDNKDRFFGRGRYARA